MEAVVGIVVAAIVAFGVVLMVAVYMAFLKSLFPETLRTDEVFYVRTNDLWILRVCRYRKERSTGEPVLLVHGMGANQNNFTCPPGNCLVDYLSEKGYDCWTVDLRGSHSSEPPFERTRDEVCLEDFFKEDIPAVIEHIKKITRYERIHWIGHSMGGMLLYAYTLHKGGDDIISGTTLGSPIDFNDAAKGIPTLPLIFAEKFPVVSGNIVRGLVPIMKALHISSFAFPINQRNLPASMNAGHFINMLEDPLPALTRQVREWMASGEYKLLDGTLDVAGSISELPVPLCAFFAKGDPFISVERAREWFGTIKNADKKMIVCSKENGFVEDYSHCDLAFSKEAIHEIFEPIFQWLIAHPSPVRSSIQEEVERFSTSKISEDKRAHILSGNAFAHLKEDEPKDVVDAAEHHDDTIRETTPKTSRSIKVEKKPAAQKATQTKTSVKKTTAVKKTAAKPAPSKKAPVKKKAAAAKTPVKPKASAKSTAPAAPTKKAAAKKTAKATKVIPAKPKRSKSADADENGAPTPEALKKATHAREERNTVFSELMASLSKPLEVDLDQ